MVVVVVVVVVFFKPTSTKPQAGKLGQTYKIMVATAIYSVTMVLWKETAFPFCRAMERRWKRNVVFRDSGDMPANLLCELNGHLMPCTSCFYGK